MVRAGQKVYTSMEIRPNFSNTGKCYLIGLAVTDDPASLGTEYLEFCSRAVQNPLAGKKTSRATSSLWPPLLSWNSRMFLRPCSTA